MNSTDAVTFMLEGTLNQSDLIYQCDIAGEAILCGELMEPVQTVSDNFCFMVSDKMVEKLNGYGGVPTDKTGPESGLTLSININQPDYSEQAKSMGAGIRVCNSTTILKNKICLYGTCGRIGFNES